MNELNSLLKKTRVSITEHLDMADDLEPELTYDDWLDLVSKNSNQLYIQSRYKKIHLKIENDIFELYLMTKLGRHDYFRLIELCSSPVKIALKNIQEHSHTEIDSYFGISTHFEALNYGKKEHDIFYVEPKEYLHVHSPVSIDIDSVSIIEESKDYIYFHIEGICFEAKELVGSFDLYCGDEKIATAANKNEVLKEAELYIEALT